MLTASHDHARTRPHWLAMLRANACRLDAGMPRRNQAIAAQTDDAAQKLVHASLSRVAQAARPALMPEARPILDPALLMQWAPTVYRVVAQQPHFRDHRTFDAALRRHERIRSSGYLIEKQVFLNIRKSIPCE